MEFTDCAFCNLELLSNQNIILKNDHCMFLQLEESKVKGTQLEGAGVIVPIKHRETVFDLTEEEWKATYSLLREVKSYLDERHEPDGYNLGWNCGEVGVSIFSMPISTSYQDMRTSHWQEKGFGICLKIR